jgi:enoyl-CoA hydratase/carnithine racemase
MRESLEELRFDRDARVLVLASAVPGAFCAGIFIKKTTIKYNI